MVPPAGTAHPEHSAEQAYIERIHEAEQLKRERLDRSAELAPDKVTGREMKRRALEKLQQPVDLDAMCFGRIDLAKGQTYYLGRGGVRDADNKLLVVNWRVPAVGAFYTANRSDPQGLQKRRRFQTDHLRLLGIVDEAFGAPTSAPSARVAPTRPAAAPQSETATPARLEPEVVSAPAVDVASDSPVEEAIEPTLEPVAEAPASEIIDAILADMERARGDEMRDIVATIEARQYELISDPIDGVLVIQGGPGSGKTAIALHRAAWLLYNHEELATSGVLVVGPNRAFMEYVAQVLPTLGETSVTQSAVDRLPDLEDVRVRGTEAPETARLKGDVRMAQVIERAVADRLRMPKETVDIGIGRTRVTLTALDIQSIVDRASVDARHYLAARDDFRRRLAGLVDARVESSRSRFRTGPSAAEIQTAVTGAADRIWPTTTAPEVVRDLLGSRLRLKTAGNGLLTDDEQKLLYRERAGLLREEPWTPADIPLLDAADVALRGVRSSYGYVLADEAQDLTPMQLQMIFRRARGGRATLVGDIAQSTGSWRFSDWTEQLLTIDVDGLLGSARIAELAISYRVPRQIMAFANELLPRIAPEIVVPNAVRPGTEDPRFVRVASSQLTLALAAEAVARIDGDRSVGLIAPHDMIAEVRSGLLDVGLEVGDVLVDGLSRQLTLLTAAQAKGLEFDHTVVVEPGAIAGTEEDWAYVYIALTRATRTLTVIHSTEHPLDPLPDEPESDPSADPASASDDVEAAAVVAAAAAAPRQVLGPRFTEALIRAKFLHADQKRRGTTIPYFAHLQSVSALVLEDGGSEDEAIAALMHDAVEDFGTDVLDQIATAFGSQVAVIVAGCTDPAGDEDTTWRELKEQHLRDLEAAGPYVRRVALAEKLDNARALLRDYRRLGPALWTRMDVDADNLLWYVAALADLFTAERPGDMASELRDTVDRLLELATEPALDDDAESADDPPVTVESA